MSTLLSIIIGMTVGSVITVGASLTGQGKALCDVLGGQYTPVGTAGESCPGGAWSALVGVRPTPR